MKLLITLTTALFIGLNSWAQIPNVTTSFDVSGIKVIFKPSRKKVINVRVYYRGGTANFPASKAGIEDFSLKGAVLCGTSNFTASALKDTCDKYDIALSGLSTFDYGYIQLNCISKYFDKGWNMFADVVTAPAYQSDEVQLLRNRLITNNRTTNSDPVISVSKQLQFNAFKNTAYGFDMYGNDEALNAITDADLKTYYYNTLLNKDRMFIVVVGNITKDELIQKIFISFANLPSKSYSKPDYTEPDLNDNKLIIKPLTARTNYLAAMGNSPRVNSPDFIPFRLAVAGLSANLYNSLVSASPLATNAGAKCFMTQMPYVNFFFTTQQPDAAIGRAVQTVKNLQQSGVDDEWLSRLKNMMVMSDFINQQNAIAVCDNLGVAEITAGWQYANDFPQLVFMATKEQVNMAINKYLTGLTWSYLGNTNNITLSQTPPLK